MRNKPHKPCSFEGCYKPARAKGLCVGHRRQEQRGKELTPPRPRAEAEPDRQCIFVEFNTHTGRHRRCERRGKRICPKHQYYYYRGEYKEYKDGLLKVSKDRFV